MPSLRRLSGKKGKAAAKGSASQRAGFRSAVAKPFHLLATRKDVLARVVLVLIALLLTLIPPFFVNDIIGYLPVLLLVLTIAFSYVCLRILVRSLEYSEDSLESSCERGSVIDFVVNFRNTGLLPFLRLDVSLYISDLFGGLDVVMPASLPLMPHESRDFSFGAKFDHIGTYSAGVHKIVISDYLGLFSHTILNSNRHQVEVIPRIFDVSRVDLSNVSVQESNRSFRPIVTDDMDYAGAREYQWGDPIKTIHWKMSARSVNDDYYTRLFEVFGNPGLGIVIDTSSPSYSSEDLMYVFDGLIESALSVNEYAREMGVESDIVYNDAGGERRVQRTLNIRDTAPLLRTIPRIHMGEGQDALDLLSKEISATHGHGNIAFCTAHASESVVTALLEAKRYKRNPLLFLVIPHRLDEEELRELMRPLKRLDAAGVVNYVVESAQDLEEKVSK